MDNTDRQLDMVAIRYMIERHANLAFLNLRRSWYRLRRQLSYTNAPVMQNSGELLRNTDDSVPDLTTTDHLERSGHQFKIYASTRPSGLGHSRVILRESTKGIIFETGFGGTVVFTSWGEGLSTPKLTVFTCIVYFSPFVISVISASVVRTLAGSGSQAIIILLVLSSLNERRLRTGKGLNVTSPVAGQEVTLPETVFTMTLNVLPGSETPFGASHSTRNEFDVIKSLSKVTFNGRKGTVYQNKKINIQK
uniref:Uncharacterized protein n=1 Tax=Glossina palpalis gambiensis TaxID=67801 RepID=A0A1B0AMN7_9MUSC